jgi:hypothetical protein
MYYCNPKQSPATNYQPGSFHEFTNSCNIKTPFKLPTVNNLDDEGKMEGNYTRYYWTSSLKNHTNGHAFFSKDAKDTLTSKEYNNALAVRCFKDSPNAPETLTYTFNQNGGNLLGATD